MKNNLRRVRRIIAILVDKSIYRYILLEKFLIMRTTNIQSKIDLIRLFISDASFKEEEYEKLIINLGLNNEVLQEFPYYLHKLAGRGLFIWQYPNQFSKYLEFLRLRNFKFDNYLEIGSRFGGTLILTSIFLETLYQKDLDKLIAVDPIQISPLLKNSVKIQLIFFIFKDSRIV